MSHSSEPDSSDDNSSFNRMVHQILNRLDVLEECMKKSSRDLGDGFPMGHKMSTPASPARKITSAQRPDQLLSDIMIRNQQIEQIKNELHQIHDALFNHFQLPRPVSNTPAYPANYRLSTDPQWRRNGQSSNSAVSQTIKEEDFMRNFISKKVQRGGSALPAVTTGKKRKKKKKAKNERGYRSEELSLSGSWEEVSHLEAESIF